MAVVCKATGVAITYFTEMAEEKENLLLMKDFVTWLALRHNTEVKVIRSDNEMNGIKIRARAQSQARLWVARTGFLRGVVAAINV